jgi:chromosome segregation protein
MKIKKISMIGFKSFMDKLAISFPTGISGIVGPNGCGKSNIVDAIRWAMGEQSAKQLRGRQMEDVIFNGAGEVKPLGMAEVSIILENGNGLFPADFVDTHEISVTRRLYRSGESEYLLNNVPCRLKDIQEIFMDTGLGSKPYSIIGQGKISSIVEQRPEETRTMIEEAAGITKYKRKMEESRRKLELTRRNLERVEDIMGEIQRQMRSLKRQASKARRFRTISEEIRRLELILNAHLYQDLKVDSANRSKAADDLLQEEVRQSTQLSSLQAKIETMNLELAEKDEEISGLRSVHLRSQEKVSKKETHLETMAGEKRMQREIEARLGVEKDDLHRRHGELQEEKAVLSQKIEKVQQGSAELEDEIALTEKRARSRREMLRQFKEAYEEARTQSQSGMSREISLNQESGYLSRRIGEITDSTSRLEQERAVVREKMDKLTKASERKSRTREALTSKLSEIDEDIKTAKQAFEELNQKRRDLESGQRSVESELHKDQSLLTSLRSLTENYEGYKVGVRTIMRADDLEPRREGRILGLVADMIQVERRFEQAFEAVLGDKLQYIIVERQTDGKEAIDYLKVHTKGRSSFIPLKDLNGTNGVSKRPDGLPLLRDLISVKDAYRPLLNALLGDATLVETFDQAMSIWQANGRSQCLVTPDGDMVDSRGIMSGGKLGPSSYGLLARKREIRELEEKVSRKQKRAERFAAELQEIVGQIEAKESSLHGLTDERVDCREKMNELDKAVFQLSHELDQLEKLNDRIANDMERKGQEQKKHAEALQKIESELVACQAKRKEEEAYLLQKEIELKESEEEFEQFRNELNRLKMDYNLAKEEERGLLREMQRIDDFSFEGQERLKKIEADIVQSRELYETCRLREDTLKEELEGLRAALDEAQRTLAAAEQDRAGQRHRIREEEDKAQSQRTELELVREKITRARMEQSEIRFKLENLVAMVKDKFDLDLAEIHGEYLEEDLSPAEVKDRLEQQKALKERMGEVNLTAIQEYEALKERHTFMSGQREDLLRSIDSLNQAIRKINKTSRENFLKTFKEVDAKLKIVFPILFNGGTAGLRLVDEDHPLESGVLVEVRPPGKKLSHMGLLSGGEKALVAMAFLFSIYLIKPSPFCLLDEVDAPLDEANINRFNDLLHEIKKHSQIILVTHNRRSMEIVDRLYGVTMEKAGVSKIVSVDLQGFERN